MTILLTGCAGFIGSHLLDKLLSKRYTVIGIDDFNDYYPPARKHTNISAHMNNLKFHLITKDICKLTADDLPSSLFPLPSSLVVVHFAAPPPLPPSINHPPFF